jgi:small subunit ribosomal protein S8
MYTDLLVKIKNGQRARKEVIKTSHSKMDFSVAEILTKHKYISEVAKKGRSPKKFLEIKLSGRLNDFHFISKPSRRLYFGYNDLKSVKHGYGLGVISTSKGIMSTQDARKQKLGGELLFEVW